ncbi:hypothetical protein MED297_20662 [Reinekea sp. MED297]|uniref:Uncharacterized protein n=1 Tax=Reinekea blandensis MED297 TaxID=314283 RepID=A4B9N7_9GAMM|nr:hypothetical protein MED297_20662 [Reinekea sp. MED297] [Reinekea blandensis MED297]
MLLFQDLQIDYLFESPDDELYKRIYIMAAF